MSLKTIFGKQIMFYKRSLMKEKKYIKIPFDLFFDF